MSVLKAIAAACLLFGLQVATVLADNRPKLDVTTTCNGAVQYAIGAGRDKETCLEDEHAAESVIAQNWSKYSADDKTQCVGTVKTGGPPSYVELLSCLEVMRDAKEFRESESAALSDKLNQPARRRGR
jgi:hypothetical protein